MSPVNPVVVEIIRNALNSAAEEMNASLFRSAYSPAIYEMKDCSVGIFNRCAEILGQSAGLPIFLGNLEECIRVTTDRIGLGSYREGDVYVVNDSYLAGTHLGDVTVFSPAFHEGVLVGFCASRAHWHDIGSKDASVCTDSTEIYHEGLRIPPLKVVDAGEMREDVLELLCMNSRLPRMLKGDLNAQIAAARTGEARLREILDRFGVGVFEEAAKEIFRQAESLDRSLVSQIPDGCYEAEGCLDNDGITEHALPVRVRVKVKGDEMTIDLTGSSGRSKGPTNCGLAQTVSACRVAFKEIISPDTPVCGGNFRNLKVVVPEGSIFAAKEPSPCQWYFSSLGLLIDLVVKALSPALPSRVAAAHYGDSMVVSIMGTRPSDGTSFCDVEATVGGWGAFDGSDGESALINVVNGDFKNLPVEFIESKFPLKVLRYGIREDSEGAGKYRGGFGAVREYQIEADDGRLSLWFERSRTPAWGLFGGKAGKGPQVVIEPGTARERSMLKCSNVPLQKGSVVRLLTGGGGGFQDPFSRDVHMVRSDVINGYISVERAREVYGVVLTKSLAIDHEATLELRGR